MEEAAFIRALDDADSTSSPAPLGRVMSALLASRPRHLEAAVSRARAAPLRSSSGAILDESLCFLRRHISDAVRCSEPLDEILVPMIEHSLKFRGSKQRRQVLILMNWLFEDDVIFGAFVSSLAAVIMAKEDHYIAFGWCVLVSDLVEFTLNEISNKGKQEKHFTLLKILFQSMSSLVSIVCKGSIQQGDYELPTRLAIAAADCILLLSETLVEAATSKTEASSKSESQLVKMTSSSNSLKEHDFNPNCTPGQKDLETEHLLWDNLDLLSALVRRLESWSRKSRVLHSKGLAQVLKWMQEIKCHYTDEHGKRGGKFLKEGVLLFCSCWKYYAMLSRLKDHRFSQCYGELLERYISAIQLYKQDENADGTANNNFETMKFFLNCLSLLMGRLDEKQREVVISEHGSKILNILFSQLQYDDEDLVEGALNILRAIIFKENLSSGNPHDTDQMDAVLPILLSFLDERDGTAKAVVQLVAEYCLVYPNGHGLKEILRRLESGDHNQKNNAIDVVSKLILICPDSESAHVLSPLLRQDIVKCLIECFGDEELMSHIQESNLLPHFDPHTVLPALVPVAYSVNEKLSISASVAIIDVLKFQNQNIDPVFTLLDCLRNIDNKAGGIEEEEDESATLFQDGQKRDVDRVLRLIPKWSHSVKNWSLLIEQSINKMFQDPSNATIVRFMSYISEQLAEEGDLVLFHILMHMQGQNEIDESWIYGSKNYSNSSSGKFKDSLFDRLCPLLLLRVLPLRVFDDLRSSFLYGNFCNTLTDTSIEGHDCVAALLLKRAFSMCEFEDVRKLSAELCGRLHPEVLLPAIEYQLKIATCNKDIVKMKTCMFSVCTSLVIRDSESVSHPIMSRIRKLLEIVLSWPSGDATDVCKAQHGCIDCLALMICAELKASCSSKDFGGTDEVADGKRCSGKRSTTSSTLNYVIQRLAHDEWLDNSSGSDRSARDSESASNDQSYNTAPPLINESMSMDSMLTPFRLCMANVFISACQKVTSPEKDIFACRVLPSVMSSIEGMTSSVIRAACLQILFSAVYHLKSSVLPFSADMFRLSIKALRKGSEKEKLAAAKLMASLMASEDDIVSSISGCLLEAKLVLTQVASRESSPELQQLSKKLLMCVSSPLDVCLSSVIS